MPETTKRLVLMLDFRVTGASVEPEPCTCPRHANPHTRLYLSTSYNAVDSTMGLCVPLSITMPLTHMLRESSDRVSVALDLARERD